MNESADRGADRTLSHLGEGLAASVTVPPVTRVFRRATPLHRALFRLEDAAAEVSVPSVRGVLRRATPRRALTAGCSICALGVVGAALVFAGTPNGSTGPSEVWAQHAGGLDGGSQPSSLTMPQFSNDQFAQDANQQPTTLAAAPQPAAAKPAAAVPAAAKPAAVTAANAAAANTAAANAAAARQTAAQSLATQLPTTTQVTPTTTQVTPTTTLTVAPSPRGATPGTPDVTLTATVLPAAAGSVQFTDNGINLSSPVSISRGPFTMTTVLSSTPHKLTAVFTPRNATAFTVSTSLEVSYLVNATATPPSGDASLVAAKTNSTAPQTVAPPLPPAPSPPPPPSRGGRSWPPVEQLQQQAPTYQLPQQAPLEQVPAQGSRRRH